MEDSNNELANKDEENTSKSFDDTGSDTAHGKSTEDSSVDSVNGEPVADEDYVAPEEQSNDSSSSTPNPYQNEDSIPTEELSNNSPSGVQIENVEYVPVSEHSSDGLNVNDDAESKSSPVWQEQSSNITASDDSNISESKIESAEKMEMENTFEVETSPTKKEIRIDMNPLTENELRRLENDFSESEDSDDNAGKNDSQKSPINPSKVDCTDDDSMSLDAEHGEAKLTINEDSIQSEDLGSIENVKVDYVPEDSEVKPEITENMSVDDDDDNANLLSKVNTNLPNTEMSNADLSALEVAQPSQKLVNTQSSSMETDLLDELSDFCGFEDQSAKDSVKALQSKTTI